MNVTKIEASIFFVAKPFYRQTIVDGENSLHYNIVDEEIFKTCYALILDHLENIQDKKILISKKEIDISV